MNVLSTDWLLAMVATVACYWLIPANFRQVVVVVATVAVLALFSPLAVALLILATLIAWAGHRYVATNGPLIAMACAAQLLPLVMWRIDAQTPIGILGDYGIPLGLSYFALRGVHYLVEGYKGNLARHTFLDVIYYFFFLPTLIAGPIHRFPSFLSDRLRVRWNASFFSEGLERILYGYVKVAFFANLMVNTHLVQWIETNTTAGTPAHHYFLMIARSLNGYLQFAGYSDVAIGFALLLGYRVMENFNAPLIKRNVQEFWSAWHISLTSWCREYVYVPTFALTRARWLGILSSMAVLGLWHEFSPRYLVWGLYNGAGIVLWHQWRHFAGERIEERLSHNPALSGAARVVSTILTLHFIFIGFVFVQEKTTTEAFHYLGTMFGLG